MDDVQPLTKPQEPWIDLGKDLYIYRQQRRCRI